MPVVVCIFATTLSPLVYTSSLYALLSLYFHLIIRQSSTFIPSCQETCFSLSRSSSKSTTPHPLFLSPPLLFMTSLLSVLYFVSLWLVALTLTLSSSLELFVSGCVDLLVIFTANS